MYCKDFLPMPMAEHKARWAVGKYVPLLKRSKTVKVSYDTTKKRDRWNHVRMSYDKTVYRYVPGLMRLRFVREPMPSNKMRGMRKVWRARCRQAGQLEFEFSKLFHTKREIKSCNSLLYRNGYNLINRIKAL